MSTCELTKDLIKNFKKNKFKPLIENGSVELIKLFFKDAENAKFLSIQAFVDVVSRILETNATMEDVLSKVNQATLDDISEPNEKIESKDKKTDNSETENTRKTFKVDYLGQYFKHNNLLKLRFKNWFNTFIGDSTRRHNGRLIYNNTLLNEAIRDLHKQLVLSILDVIPDSQKVNIKSEIYLDNGTEDNGILAFLNQRSVINKMKLIKNSLLNSNDNLIKAYYAFIALNHFDEAVDDVFDGGIKIINPGRSFNTTKIKYFIGTGEGVIDNWRDDSKDYEYTKEMSKSVINIVLATPLMINGQQKGNLEWNLFVQTFQSIRKLYSITDNSFREEYYGLFKENIRHRSVRELLSAAKKNGVEEYRQLFAYLSNADIPGLTSIDKLYIQSFYKDVFDPKNPNSYYSCFKNSSLLEKSENINYYLDVIQTLNSMENLDLQGYRIDLNDNLVNYNLVNTKRDQYVSEALLYISSVLNSITAMLNGNMNIIPNMKFTTDFKNDLKTITITTNNGDTEYKIIHTFNKKAKNPKGAYTTTFKINNNDVNVNNLNPSDFEYIYSEIIGKIFLILPNSQFIASRKNLILNDLNLASHMVYNYLVSYSILSDNGSTKIKSETFRERAKEYFYEQRGDTVPKISNTHQFDVLSIGQKASRGSDFPNFQEMIQDYVLSLGVGKDNTVRDSYNNSINTVSLSLRISKIENIWDELHVDYQNDALAGTALFYAAYRNVAFMRDFKSRTGEVKKCVDFNFNEFFASTFLLDYMNNLYDPKKKEFGIFGDVISDKSKLPVIMLDKLTEIKRADGTGYVSLIDAKPEDFELHMKESFGLFYSNMINRVLDDMTKLSLIDISKFKYVSLDGTLVNKINLSVSNNYAELNNLRKLDLDGKLLKLSSKEITYLLHYMTAEVMKLDTLFKINLGTHYILITLKDKNGVESTKVSVNPTIIHQGLLYSSDGKLMNLSVSLWNNILGGYVTVENCNLSNFLKGKHELLIADLLQNQMLLKLRDKGAGFDRLKNVSGWYSRGKVVLAKIHSTNNGIKSDTDITEISDLRSWYYYKFLMDFSKKSTTDLILYLAKLNNNLYKALENNYNLTASTDVESKNKNLELISLLLERLDMKGKGRLLNSLHINGISSDLLIDELLATKFDINRPSFKFNLTLRYAGILSNILKLDFTRNELNSFIRRRQFEKEEYLNGPEGAISIFNGVTSRQNAINELVRFRWDHIIKDVPRNLSTEDKENIDNNNYQDKYSELFKDLLEANNIKDKKGNYRLSKDLTYALYSYIQRLNTNLDSFVKSYISMKHSDVFDAINSLSYEEAESIYQKYLQQASNEGEEKLKKYRDDSKSIYEKDDNNNIKIENDGAVRKSLNQENFDLEVNKELVKFNLLSHDYGELFSMTSVGTFTIHPSKLLSNGDLDLSAIEALMYGLRTKRNVIETATKHQYSRGKLNGIGYTMKMMVIEDAENDVYNIMGEKGNATVWDGATFVNPFMDVLENNSLGGNAVGTDKKLFCSSVDKRTGSGFILKTAGFSLTNARIRNAKSLKRTKDGIIVSDGKFGILMKKMTNTITWTSLLNDPNILNIINDSNIKQYNLKRANNGLNYIDFMVDSDGNTIKYNDIYIYNPKNDSFFKREILGFDNNSGEVIYRDYNLNNNLEKLLGYSEYRSKIDTSYLLWKLFGGEYSSHLQDGKLTYENDNNSVNAVVSAMNNVGIRRTNGNISTLDLLYQIIKDSLICYAATEGATKIASYNKNSIDIFLDENYLPTYFSVDTADLGIQLNAEHEVSGSILSLMTQVVNALGARGYSLDPSNAVYKSLLTITRNNLSGLLNGINSDFNSEEHEKFKDAIADIIINSIKKTTNTDGNIMVALAQTLLAYNDGSVKGFDKLVGKFPFSDPAIFNKLVTNIASSITKSSISIKFPGSLSVMVPSDGLIRLYNGHMAGYYSNKFDELLKLANNTLKVKLYLAEMDTLYRIFNKSGEDVTDMFMLTTGMLNGKYKINYKEDTGSILMDPETYFGLKEKLPKDYYLVEDLIAGRELRPSNTTFKDISGNDYNIWDLDVVLELYDLNTLLKTSKDKNPIKEQITEKRKELLDCLNALGSGKELSVKIKGNNVIVNKDSVKVRPYELIMGKIFQELFGLEDGVTLGEIDIKYFINKLLNKTLSANIENTKFDIELKNINGKSTILKYKENPVSNILSRWINNKLYRVDVLGNKLYSIPDPNIEILTDENGNEIIYTNNLLYFIKSVNPANIILSTNDANSFKNSVLALKESGNKLATRIYDTIAKDSDNVDWDKAMKEYLSDLNDIKNKFNDFRLEINKAEDPYELFKDKNFWKKYSKFSGIINSARELNTSFLESLKFIATRTPAQSHQSFMAMKVVGFDNSGKNSAYVSRWLIWLLGSDYDIDKVSLLGRTIGKSGKLKAWSPFLNLKSTKSWDVGESIEFPTGNEILTTSESKVDEYIYAATGVENTESNTSENIFKVISYYNNILKNNVKYSNDYVFNNTGLGYRISSHNGLITLNLKGKFNLYDTTLILLQAIKNIAESGTTDLIAIISSNKGTLTLVLDSLGIEYLELKDSENIVIQPDSYLNIKPSKIFRAINDAALSFINSTSNTEDTDSIDFLDMYDGIKSRKDLKGIVNKLSRRSSNIRVMSDMISLYNSLPRIANNSESIKFFSDLINYHNTYYLNDKHSELDAAQNFIASLMYNIMTSPDNIILGSTSIDDPTKIIKKLTEELEFNRLAGQVNTFDPGSVSSKFLLVVLTLSGKANTANAASAMKKFEAISAAYNKILNTYGENYYALVSNLNILGKELKLMANTYVNDDSKLSEEIRKYLDNVDQNTDAFIQLSAILSLSTDNAKDPTLSKINCGPDMLGLYTAGIMAGLDIRTLVKLMLSDTGIMLLDVMNGNIVTGDKGFDRLSKAISFLKNGPVKELGQNIAVKKFINNAYTAYYLKELPKDSFALLRGIIGNGNSYSISRARGFLKFLQRATSTRGRQKAKVAEYLNSITIGLLIKAAKNDANYKLSKLPKKQLNSDEARNLKNTLYQLALFDSNTDFLSKTLNDSTLALNGKYRRLFDLIYKHIKPYTDSITYMKSDKSFQEHETNHIYDIIDLENKYIASQYTIKYDTIIGLDGEEYSIFNELSKLSKLNDEIMKVNKACKLNQGLPTNLQEFLSLILGIENLLVTSKYTLAKKHADDKQEGPLYDLLLYNLNSLNMSLDDSYKIDIIEFATNKKYRNLVTNAYNVVKDYLNVPAVWGGNDHYLGYMLCLGLANKIYNTSMALYRELSEYNNSIIRKYYLDSDINTSNKAIKNLNTYLFQRRINTYLRSNIPPFDVTTKFYDRSGKLSDNEELIFIKLGTELGNKNFKLWMDTKVFPWLLSNYNTNDFVKNLTKVEFLYNLDGKVTVNYATKAKTLFNNPLELEIFLKTKNGLRLLSYVKYDNVKIPVLDLIYLYNLIAYNSSYGKNNFTNLFEDVIAEGNDQIINNYILYINYNDFRESNIDVSKDTVDSILRLICPKVRYASQLSSLKTPYAMVIDDYGEYRLVINKDYDKLRNDKLLIIQSELDNGGDYDYDPSMDEALGDILDVQEALEDNDQKVGTKKSFLSELKKSQYKEVTDTQNSGVSSLFYEGDILTSELDGTRIIINPGGQSGAIYNNLNQFINDNKDSTVKSLINKGYLNINKRNFNISDLSDIKLNEILNYDNNGNISININAINMIIDNKLELDNMLKTCNA